MKKFYFLAVAALMLASCTSEENLKSPVESKEIAFNAVVKNASRGAVNAKVKWGADIFVASSYQADATGKYSNYFGTTDFVEFTYGGANWTSEHVYFYPDHGKLDFLAYASGTEGDDQILPTATLRRLTDESSDKDISGMDLDYSTNKLEGKTDVMYAFTANTPCPYDDKVGLEFKHALSWVTVAISESLNKVKIVSLTLDDVYLTGKVSIPVSGHTTSTSLGNPTWTVASTDKQSHAQFAAFCPATPTLVKDLTNVGDGLLIVPGVMTTGKQTSLTLKHEMTDNPGVVITTVIPLNALPDWKPGLHYEYDITINLQAIEFKCTVSDFGTGTDVPSGGIKL